MKHFGAILALLVLLPVAAAGGYVAHGEPGMEQFLKAHLKVDKESDDLYSFVVIKGRNAGISFPAVQVLPYTDADIRKNGDKVWKWMRAKCVNLSTTGKADVVDDAEMVSYCSQKEVTRKQAMDGILATAPPPPAKS